MYDDNGNMVTDETNKDYVYDAWNRLVEVLNSSNVTVAEYGVDGLGRRISETTSGGTRHQYYSANWQVLEERDESRTNDTLQQYVWSPVYIDALVLRDSDTADDGTLDQRLWVAQDANFNVTALYNNSGTVVERFAYSPYGTAAVLNASFTSIGTSAYDWAYRHQGGRWDATSGLVHFRHRDLSTTLGRWMSNDPLKYQAGDNNLFGYVANNPTNYVDYSGLFISIIIEEIFSVDIMDFELSKHIFGPRIKSRPITKAGGIHGSGVDPPLGPAYQPLPGMPRRDIPPE